MKQLLKKIMGRQLETSPSQDLSWADQKDLDDHDALRKAAQYLAHCIGDSSLSSSDRCKMILAIDERNRHRINSSTHKFVSYHHFSPTLAAEMYESAFFYHRQIYKCYHTLIHEFLEHPDSLTFSFAQFPLILGRAMCASYAMMKWRYYSLESIAENIWLEIFELYKIAEQESLLDAAIQLYQDEAEINLNAGFIQACMLGSLHQPSLTKKHTETISKLLHRWMNSSAVSSVYEKKHLFVIDLESDQSAKRIRHISSKSSCRYWDIDQFSLRINATIRAIENNQSLEDLGISDLGSAAELLPLFRLMHSEWTKTQYKRQRRVSDRKQTTKLATPIYGIDEICKRVRHIDNSIYTHMVDVSEIEMLQQRQSLGKAAKTAPNVFNRDFGGDKWIIRDESSMGYGIQVDHELNPQVKLGKLVALTFKDKPNQMILGSIQSIKKLASGKHHVGFKILAKKAFWIEFSHVGLKTNKQELIDSFTESPAETNNRFPVLSGIYLPAEENLSEKPFLLLPRLEFQKNSIYQLVILGKKTITLLADIAEEKDDWVKVVCPEVATSNYSSKLLQPPPSALNKSTVATNLA